jgi:plasmid stability protein
MGQDNIRNLDDRIIELWKAKADLEGMSLEQTLRDLLVREAPLIPDQKLAMVKAFRESNRRNQTSDSVDLIREDRDAR